MGDGEDGRACEGDGLAQEALDEPVMEVEVQVEALEKMTGGPEAHCRSREIPQG